MIWRCVRSAYIPDTFLDVTRAWTFVDLIDAHMFLDAQEDMDRVDAPK